MLEYILSDVIGPMQTILAGRSIYILTFVGDYSKYVSVYFLKTKVQVTKEVGEIN